MSDPTAYGGHMFRRLLRPLVAVVVVVGLWAVASPAGAVDNPAYSSPPPSTVVTTTAPTSSNQVETAVQVAPARDTLAITGSDATGLAVIGSILVLVGAGALVLRRRNVPAS